MFIANFFPLISPLPLILASLFFCTHRFDSWAGMALARASRIQDKLNSNEMKNDGPIWKHAPAVLNCFKRALEIDTSNLSLWIEYGTMSYTLHSFASRQLKQLIREVPPEMVAQVKCYHVIRKVLPAIYYHCNAYNRTNYLQ